MKSSQTHVLAVNNDLPVPPGDGCLCPCGVQLEDLEEDVDKNIVVKRAVFAAPLILRADRKPHLF